MHSWKKYYHKQKSQVYDNRSYSYLTCQRTNLYSSSTNGDEGMEGLHEEYVYDVEEASHSLIQSSGNILINDFEEWITGS